MAARLQESLPNIISPHQTAFIKGHSIHHNILLAHELVHLLGQKGKPRAYIKIDLQKAFDSVRWPYLEEVLRGFHFSETWINWCMECVTTPKYSVLINGSPEGFFTSSWRLGQGDPLSLFSLCLYWSLFLSPSISSVKRVI
ncbi:hypothetical protein QJS04_geneDACA007014 [Acorus gramineus]|uniref:Reverse transcriptase domain-containing protein n=1 Tax=Acorus gramineus TaxID=55184 RepID=A0AAV9A2N3_ACOGR|nr:hypothetical protein QJS04_geneDACA007014 [Acorus gramineus]